MTAARAGAVTGAAADAVLLGDMEMAQALRATGARVTVVGPRAAPSRFSRHSYGWSRDGGPDEGERCRALVAQGRRLDRPVLFVQTDEDLLFVSRHRDDLSRVFGLLLPEHDLVRALVDKQAFQGLAERRGLPVPRTVVVDTASPPCDLGLTWPVVVKPRTRDCSWVASAGGAKVLLARDREELAAALARVPAGHPCVLVQEHVAGPEQRVESYHVYADGDGEVVGEFTGRKVRTLPREHGFSTALVTTDDEDVRRAGRDVVARLGLVGLAKLDFKRDASGRLWLLEVNPRCNLWHRIGAAAGVDLSALLLADLRGSPRPPVGPPRAGVTWVHVPKDLLAAREEGWSTLRWCAWARGCDLRAGLDPADPLPFLLGRALPWLLGTATAR